MQILNGSIDLAKIDKSKIKEMTLKNGNVAKFLDITIIVNDSLDKFGKDGSISMSQSKEEREAKHSKTFIGNVKKVYDNSGSGTKSVNKQSNEDLF